MGFPAPCRAANRHDPVPARGSLAVLRAALACAVLAAGCRGPTILGIATGRTKPDPIGAKPAVAARTAPRTIPVDMRFVRFAATDEALAGEFWTFVDEQAIAADLRQRLAANGLRCGIVTAALPPHLAAWITRPVEGTMADDPQVSQRLLRLLPDRRNEIVASAALPELVLLEHAAGTVRGGTFHDATALFELRAQPAADGRVRLELTPEIKHGPLERSWVGEDGMFRMEAGQRQHRREDLRIDVVLSADAILAIGCADGGDTTIGAALLRDSGGSRITRRLLLLHLEGRTTDPMFSDDASDLESREDDRGITIR